MPEMSPPSGGAGTDTGSGGRRGSWKLGACVVGTLAILRNGLDHPAYGGAMMADMYTRFWRGLFPSLVVYVATVQLCVVASNRHILPCSGKNDI